MTQPELHDQFLALDLGPVPDALNFQFSREAFGNAGNKVVNQSPGSSPHLPRREFICPGFDPDLLAFTTHFHFVGKSDTEFPQLSLGRDDLSSEVDVDAFGDIHGVFANSGHGIFRLLPNKVLKNLAKNFATNVLVAGFRIRKHPLRGR